MNKPLTTRLNDGREVLAKFYQGEPFAVTYANRTQANRKAAELGPGWDVVRCVSGRPFYVQRAPAHVRGKPCPICTRPGALFPAVHHQGPPCLECRADMETIGTPPELHYRCPNCGATRPIPNDHTPSA